MHADSMFNTRRIRRMPTARHLGPMANGRELDFITRT